MVVRAYYEDGDVGVLVNSDGSKEHVARAYGKVNPVCKKGSWPGCDQCERGHCSTACLEFNGV